MAPERADSHQRSRKHALLSIGLDVSLGPFLKWRSKAGSRRGIGESRRAASAFGIGSGL